MLSWYTKCIWYDNFAVVSLIFPLLMLQVAGVVGRAELMSAICFFLALLCYMSACDEECGWLGVGCRLAATTLLAGSALLFKEQGITVVVKSYATH